MRRKVAAICVSALTLAVSGGALAAGQGQSGSQQGQQNDMQGSQTGSGAQAGSSASGQRSSDQTTVQGQTSTQGSSMSGQASTSASASGQRQSQQGSAAAQQGSAPGTISYTQLSREQVKMLQRALQDDGRYQGNIDGIIGPKTIAALHDFQAQNGLRGGGSLNQQTLDAMGLTWGQLQAVSGREAGKATQAGAQPQNATGQNQSNAPRQSMVGNEGLQLSQLSTDQVKELQQKLQDLGFYKGQIDGTIGRRTRAALQQFYSRQAQLAARGMISEDGASALGLSVNAAEPVSGSEQQSQPMGTSPNQPRTNQNQPTQSSQTRTQQRGTGSQSQPRTQSGTSTSPSPATPYDQEDEGTRRYPEGGP